MSVFSQTIVWLVVKFVFLATFVLSMAWVDSLHAAPQTRKVPPGLWGGDHVRMIVSSDGALLEYDCANGKIDRPLILDVKGGFSMQGSYIAERGGPRRDADAARTRARYVGRVSGDTMRLTVTLDNSKKPVGEFALTRGTDTLLTKCR
jgi:hypothetical protein